SKCVRLIDTHQVAGAGVKKCADKRAAGVENRRSIWVDVQVSITRRIDEPTGPGGGNAPRVSRRSRLNGIIAVADTEKTNICLGIVEIPQVVDADLEIRAGTGNHTRPSGVGGNSEYGERRRKKTQGASHGGPSFA